MRGANFADALIFIHKTLSYPAAFEWPAKA